VLLYCCKSWAFNNWLGLWRAGVMVRPLTCPPLNSASFPYWKMDAASLVYVALHGMEGVEDVLVGDDRIPALSSNRIKDMGGIFATGGQVVILEGCFGLSTAFPQAFIDAGAEVVIGARTPTVDRRVTLGPAGKAGSRAVRVLLNCGTVAQAVTAAGGLFEAVGDLSARLRLK